MSPIIQVRDNFFKDPMTIRGQLLASNYSDIISPVDGVIYPTINLNVPKDVIDRVHLGLLLTNHFAGIKIRHVFARAMMEGVKAPGPIHSDKIMGEFSAHVYLSLDWPEGAGTYFLEHKTQGKIHTDETDLTQCDFENKADWAVYDGVQGKFNRLVVHKANAWHLAEPSTGWGHSPGTARLVLTCFFDSV